MKAEWAWIALVALILFGMIFTGIADIMLTSYGRQSITAWLRENPGWFLVPAMLIEAWIGLLALHLFRAI